MLPDVSGGGGGGGGGWSLFCNACRGALSSFAIISLIALIVFCCRVAVSVVPDHTHLLSDLDPNCLTP